MTIIVPARNEHQAQRIAEARRIPDDAWTWIDPDIADAYAARCVAFGVDAHVLTARPAARTVVVSTAHERSRAA